MRALGMYAGWAAERKERLRTTVTIYMSEELRRFMTDYYYFGAKTWKDGEGKTKEHVVLLFPSGGGTIEAKMLLLLT